MLVLSTLDPVFPSVTTYALREIVRLDPHACPTYQPRSEEEREAIRAVETALPLAARVGEIAVYEGTDILATIDPGLITRLKVRVDPALTDTLTDPLRAFVREWMRRRAGGEPEPIPF